MAKKKIVKDNNSEPIDIYTSLESICSEEVDINDLKDDIEFWLNTRLDFVLLWEQIFNKTDFDVELTDSECLTLDNLTNSGSISFIKRDSGFFIHPHMMLAYSLNDSISLLNLVVGMMELPEKYLDKLVKSTFKTV